MKSRGDAGVSRDSGEQRREQMLRAALEVIVERGYADTRIADVAERTGTSPALVIYYFKTRDQLLTEAIRYSEDTWYAEYLRRTAKIQTAAGQLTELIAMNCLPGTDPDELDRSGTDLTDTIRQLAPGHYEVTVQNLKVVEVRGDTNIVMIEGAIPGPKQGYVVIKKAVKKSGSAK